MSDKASDSHHDSSLSDGPLAPFPGFINNVDDGFDSQPDSKLAVESVNDSFRDSRTLRDDNATMNRGDEMATHALNCDLCLRLGRPKNKVDKATMDEKESFSNIRFDDGEGGIWCPFSSMSSNGQESGRTNISSPLICRQCLRLFRKFAKVDSDEVFSQRRAKVVAAEKSRFFLRRKQKLLQSSESTDEDPLECFMKEKGSIECTSGRTKYSRPTRLLSKSEAVRKRWCYWFAQRNEIPFSLAEKVASNAKTIRLWSIHTGEMGSCLSKVQTESRICSVCNETGTVRRPKEVTIFPWARLSKDENNVCVVEDALATFKGTSIRPADIKYICNPCRKVVCRDIDMRANLPRDQTESVSRDLRPVVDYGPTPLAIRRCIMFVKKELAKQGVFVVFLKTLREVYNSSVRENGEERNALKDDRSLKKYIQPSLAAAEIHLMLGALKVGSFFCVVLCVLLTV